MATEIVSGATSDKWTIDATSKAGRVTLYDAAGNILNGAGRTIRGVYSYALTDVAGQTGSTYDFLSLFNPGSSGIKIALLKADYMAYAIAAAVTKNSIRLSTTSAASAGTAPAASTFAEHQSGYPAALGVIRHTDPSVTIVADIKAFAPPCCITAVGCYAAAEIDLNPRDEREQIILLENEGVCFNQAAAGDADQTFCFRLSWMEFTGTA